MLIDDLVDTAGTLCQAAEALKEQGALRVVAYITTIRCCPARPWSVSAAPLWMNWW